MSSKQFGGQHSPGNPTPSTPRGKAWNKPAQRSSMAANLLFFIPFPLLLDGLSKIADAEPLAMLSSFGAYGILILSAWILREGLKAEAAYAERKIAKPPVFPRKIVASVLTGVGVMVSAWLGWGQGMFTALIFGTMATAAHLGAFGIDPLRKKGMDDQNEFEIERVAKVVEKAEQTIEDLLAAATRINSREIQGRIDGLIMAVRDIIRRIEDDPRDLTRARKYMTVYLTGAKDATVKFADLYSKDRSTTARDDYVALIDDLETSFNTQHDALLLDDRSDLDVEIEVLQDRLKQEGLKARI